VIFTAICEGEYRAAVPEFNIEFHVGRLRYERHELHGELMVCCGLAGARVFDDATLSASTMNFSSAQTRSNHGKRLAERARTGGKVDWTGLLEELSVRVLAAERAGQPAVILSQVPAGTAEPVITIDGYPIYTRHHQIDFGDGGSAKSLYALWRGGKLEAAGERVGLFDWELDVLTHRHRLEQLFGRLAMPAIRYIRCDRPLVHDVDRLRRIIVDEAITYGIFDSVGFACDGPPEAAESALKYFQAVRQLRIGGLHLAHVSKAETGDQRPFGSAFWHNSARSTWFVKAATSEPATKTIGLINRKANLGPLHPALAYTFTFSPDRITVEQVAAVSVDELVDSLPMWQRLKDALRTGPRTLASLAEDLGAKVDTVEKAVKRKSGLFTRVLSQDGVQRIALIERRTA
jgi:hypothetical protein